MLRIKKVFLAMAAMIVATSAAAAEVDGKWIGVLGQSEITFEFKADGENLSGTLNNAALAGATPIKDGKIKGADLTFHVVRTLNDAETKVEWKGALAGDEIKLQRAAVTGNAAAEVTVKRVKP